MAFVNLGKKKKKEYHRNSEKQDPNRKLRQQFYGKEEWKKLRFAKLYEEPLCEVCKIKGMVQGKEILTLAEDVHHLRSFTSGRTFNEMECLFYDFNNLVSICKRCHNSLHHGELKGCFDLEEVKERLKFLKEEETDLQNYLYKGTNN